MKWLNLLALKPIFFSMIQAQMLLNLSNIEYWNFQKFPSFLIMWYCGIKFLSHFFALLIHALVFGIIVKNQVISMFQSKLSIRWNLFIVFTYDF